MGGFSSPAKGKDVVLLKKELMDGILLKPARGGDAVVGAVYVSIGKLLIALTTRADGQDEKMLPVEKSARHGKKSRLPAGSWYGSSPGQLVFGTLPLMKPQRS